MKLVRFVMLLLFFVSTNVVAQEEMGQEIEGDTITLEEATVDITNRMILATMGPTALQTFTSKNIENLYQEGYVDYVKPFPYVYDLTAYFFGISVMIALVFAVIYFTYIVFDTIIKSQKSGYFLGDNWNAVFTALKIVIAFLLVIPITVGDESEELKNKKIMNGAQFVLIKTLGFSNEAGYGLNKTLQDSQPRMYPQIRTPPASFVFSELGLNMIEFAECLNLNREKGRVERTVYYIDSRDQINISAQTENCYIGINFSDDGFAKSIIDESEELRDFFRQRYSKINNFEYIDEDSAYNNYVGGLVNGYVIVFDKLLNIAAKVADNTLLPHRSGEPENFEDALAASDLKDFMISNNGNIPYEESCETMYNYDFGGNIYESDKRFYKKYISYCLSYELLKSTTYPKNIDNYYIKNYNEKNIGYPNTILCGTPNEAVVGGTEYSQSGKTIFDCVAEKCSSLDTIRPNNYMCSSAIHLYGKNVKSHDIASLGFLVLGGAIYSNFATDENRTAMAVINNIQLSNRGQNNVLSAHIKSSFSNIIDLSTPNDKNNTKTTNLLSREFNMLNDFGDQIAKSHQKFTIQYSVERMLECTKNPLSYSSGFMCGSIPQEYNRFGRELLSLYIMSKYASIAGQKINQIRLKESSDVISATEQTVREKALQILMSTLKAIGVGAALDGLADAALTPESGFEGDKFTEYNSSFYEEYLMVSDISGIKMTLPILYFLEASFGLNLGITTLILNFLLIAAILIGFVVPLMPFWFYFMIIINILIIFYTKMFTFPLVSAFIMKPSNNHSSDEIKTFISVIIEFLFKVPLTIIGLIMSWILTNSVVSKIFNIISLDNILISNPSNPVSEILVLLFSNVFSVIIYIVLFYIVTNLTMGVMDAFERFTLSLIQNSGFRVGIGASEAANLSSKVKQYAYYSHRAGKKMDRAKDMNKEKRDSLRKFLKMNNNK